MIKKPTVYKIMLSGARLVNNNWSHTQVPLLYKRNLGRARTIANVIQKSLDRYNREVTRKIREFREENLNAIVTIEEDVRIQKEVQRFFPKLFDFEDFRGRKILGDYIAHTIYLKEVEFQPKWSIY